MGTQMAQWIKRLALDLSSGLDLRVVKSSPILNSMLGMKQTLIKIKKKKSRDEAESPIFLHGEFSPS